MSFDPFDWDPTDPINHFDDYLFNQMWNYAQERRREQEITDAKKARANKALKEKFIQQTKIQKETAIKELQFYLENLTPRRRSELEALLSRLNIILPASDSTESEVPDVEAAAVNADAERDLEQYLSKLTSDKREKLEAIINSYRQASAALDELQKSSKAKQTSKNELTNEQAAIVWGFVILAAILAAILTYLYNSL